MRLIARRFWLLAGASLIAAPAHADDLREALTAAYQTNPTLEAARASQRAVDESVPIARASGLPSLSGAASYTEFLQKSANSFTSPDRAIVGSVSLSVPIYSGGAVRNSLQAAETRVQAGQADLRGSESGIFSQVVAAYMDVIRDSAVVGLNRTDVAQSQSRLALARSDTRSAESNLIASRERYIQVVGKPPVNLQPPPPLAGLPNSPDEAVTIALDNNPDLLAARQRTKAAGFDSDAAGAGRMPKVSIFAGADHTDYLGTLGGSSAAGVFAQTSNTAQAGVRASIPIFSGGLPAAQQRQAQARENAVMDQEIGVERQVIAQVRAAYASQRAANEIIASIQVAVDAATLSLEGVRAENSVGNRNILDAEQELLRAQTQLVSARRNAYVAGFSLLAAMGKAEAQDLGLDGGVLYDPDVNYERVRHKLSDWSRDPDPVAGATRTVDTPAQDGAIPK